MRTTFILAVASFAFGLASSALGPALAAGGGGGGGGSSEVAPSRPAKPVDPSFAQGKALIEAKRYQERPKQDWLASVDRYRVRSWRGPSWGPRGTSCSGRI